MLVSPHAAAIDKYTFSLNTSKKKKKIIVIAPPLSPEKRDATEGEEKKEHPRVYRVFIQLAIIHEVISIPDVETNNNFEWLTGARNTTW